MKDHDSWNEQPILHPLVAAVILSVTALTRPAGTEMREAVVSFNLTTYVSF
jgi:hypothetical protein